MRLVDADWVLAHIKPYEPSYEYWVITGGTAIRLIENAVNNAPTVDAVPVVHATLEDMGIVEDDREWVCSNCKAEFTVCVCGKDRTGYIKHCPYCGAMIIGERKGGDE